MKAKLLHIGKLLLITLMVVSSLQIPVLAPAAGAVSQKDIDKLKDEASGFNDEKKELQKQVDALKADKKNALKKKNLLDQQSEALAGQIGAIEQIIADYDTMIAQSEAELAEAQAKEELQYERFCRRVRAMEENGSVSYWSVLFKAENFTDLLSRLSDIQEIMDYDQRIIAQYKQTQAEVSAKMAELESQKADQEAQRQELRDRKQELDDQRSAAAQIVKDIQADEKAAQEALDEKEKEYNRIQREIKKKEEELAAQLGEGTKGGYIWPTASRYITSPYGKRVHPITGRVKYHKGIDIGRVYFTSEVKAAKAGVVITSARSSSYGNYVVISHGSGNSTLYAHMSKRKVKVGDKVKQGQVIGITGSTGLSNGPHLHFEIREGGANVDPLKYLTNYIRGRW